ncbi:MAG: RNA pseudouridine synthase [Sandaracinus sp.]|nr:RNA pseudouridine synthase [Sandaracinus sp.]MCB9634056.1 RNA pseudouridine synthase [Sandaracinus sp.]
MLPLLLERDGLVAVDKPIGLPTTGRDLDDPRCVQHVLAVQLERPVWAVHQLDAGTSGVCLFVTKKSLVATWSEHLARGEKRYLALVHGVPTWSTTRVDAPLRYVKAKNRVAVVPDGKDARTELRRLTHGPAHALVEARPKTGRTHQVRVHLAHVGHPLVGDALHGPGDADVSHARLHLREVRLGDDTLKSALPEAWAAVAVSRGVEIAGY